MRNFLLLLVLAFVATTAHAQAVFRSVMPDGKVVYGDKPAPGAKEAKQVNLPKPNISSPTQPGAGATGAADPNAPAPTSAIDAATARQNLDAARKALEAGREQKEGDRIGTSKGGSRLTDDYLQRVKALEDAVASAQNQLDAAERNASR